MMSEPTRWDVLAYLDKNEVGQGDAAQVDTILNVACQMVYGYTRGRGFESITPTVWCDEAIAAVIVSCAARLLHNPTLDRLQTAGPFSNTPGVFNGWTLAELAILNNYRVRAR